MEYIVSSCKMCGGWCCKALVTNDFSVPAWVKLEHKDVVSKNLWIPSEVKIQTFQWASCACLSSKGLCCQYWDRPTVCRDYPNMNTLFMEYLSDLAWFYVPWCSYRADVLEVLGVKYKFVETGEQCRLLYLKEILEDPSFANDFHGAKLLLEQADEQSCTPKS